MKDPLGDVDIGQAHQDLRGHHITGRPWGEAQAIKRDAAAGEARCAACPIEERIGRGCRGSCTRLALPQLLQCIEDVLSPARKVLHLAHQVVVIQPQTNHKDVFAPRAGEVKLDMMAFRRNARTT